MRQAHASLSLQVIGRHTCFFFGVSLLRGVVGSDEGEDGSRACETAGLTHQ